MSQERISVDQARAYFRGVQGDLQTLADTPDFRAEYFAEEKASETFEDAQTVLRERSAQQKAERVAGIGRPIPQVIAIETRRARIAAREAEQVVSETEESTETTTQETIRWAYSVIEEYKDAVPATGTRKQREEAMRMFVRNRIETIAMEPDRIETALSVWKAQSEESGFYRQAKEQLPKVFRDKWEEIPPHVLGELVTKYSRDGYVAREFGDILKGYFEGPKTIEGRVDSYYHFADAALDLLDDPEALRAAALIGGFETDIIPRRGDTFVAINVATVHGSFDPQMQRRAQVADRVAISSITKLTDLDREAILQRNIAATEGIMRDPKVRNLVHRSQKRSVRENPRGYNDYVTNTLRTFGKVLNRKPSGYEVMKSLLQGEVNIDESDEAVFDAEIQSLYADPVGKKTFDRAFGRSTAYLHRKYASEELQEDGQEPVIITRYVQGKIVELAVPASLGTQVQQVFESLSFDEEIDLIDGSPFQAVVPTTQSFDGKPIFAWIRKLDVGEGGERHPLERLNEIGFPIVDVDDLREANVELATQIVAEQRRFMNTRGFSVPLSHPALEALGYQNFTFKKNEDDNRVTDVTINVRGEEIVLKLDQDLRFDFEGMPCDLPRIGESLYHVMLTVLYPALCGVSVKDNEGRETDLRHVFQTRVGYIGYLGEGKGYSDKKVEEFFEIEGRDLPTISEQRKVLDPTGQGRNSTYWKPVESDDPTKPPVRVNIPLPEDIFKVQGAAAPKERQIVTEVQTVVELPPIQFKDGDRDRTQTPRTAVNPLGIADSENPDILVRDVGRDLRAVADIRSLEERFAGMEAQQSERIRQRAELPEYSKERVKLEQEIAAAHWSILDIASGLQGERNFIAQAAAEGRSDPDIAAIIGDRELSDIEVLHIIADVADQVYAQMLADRRGQAEEVIVYGEGLDAIEESTTALEDADPPAPDITQHRSISSREGRRVERRPNPNNIRSKNK